MGGIRERDEHGSADEVMSAPAQPADCFEQPVDQRLVRRATERKASRKMQLRVGARRAISVAEPCSLGRAIADGDAAENVVIAGRVDNTEVVSLCRRAA